METETRQLYFVSIMCWPNGSPDVVHQFIQETSVTRGVTRVLCVGTLLRPLIRLTLDTLCSVDRS